MFAVGINKTLKLKLYMAKNANLVGHPVQVQKFSSFWPTRADMWLKKLQVVPSKPKYTGKHNMLDSENEFVVEYTASWLF